MICVFRHDLEFEDVYDPEGSQSRRTSNVRTGTRTVSDSDRHASSTHAGSLSSSTRNKSVSTIGNICVDKSGHRNTDWTFFRVRREDCRAACRTASRTQMLLTSDFQGPLIR